MDDQVVARDARQLQEIPGITRPVGKLSFLSNHRISICQKTKEKIFSMYPEIKIYSPSLLEFFFDIVLLLLVYALFICIGLATHHLLIIGMGFDIVFFFWGFVMVFFFRLYAFNFLLKRLDHCNIPT